MFGAKIYALPWACRLAIGVTDERVGQSKMVALTPHGIDLSTDTVWYFL